MSGGPMLAEMGGRRRDVPVVSAIVHDSFGNSSFFTGLSASWSRGARFVAADHELTSDD